MNTNNQLYKINDEAAAVLSEVVETINKLKAAGKPTAKRKFFRRWNTAARRQSSRQEILY